jgi:hypothetical protein
MINDCKLPAADQFVGGFEEPLILKSVFRIMDCELICWDEVFNLFSKTVITLSAMASIGCAIAVTGGEKSLNTS